MEQNSNGAKCIANESQSSVSGQDRVPQPSKPSVVIQVEVDDPLGLRRILSNNPRGNSRNLAPGDSPDSGSLYSDEIPSGYNSGEQYDTLSTGYMSGEAYELPETRLELHEPTLDPIEEGSSLANTSDGDVFHHLNLTESGKISTTSITSLSSVEGTVRVVEPPLGHPAIKSKLRKKSSNAGPSQVQVEALGIDLEAYESSDACIEVTSRSNCGYHSVPSNTDTSGVDSDPNAVLTDGSNDSSGTELLRLSSHGRPPRPGQKGYKKNLANHDETWFESKDNKYWSAMRVGCFWLTILSMLLCIVTAGILIWTMPKNCDPQRDWYQGHVIMDIHVSSTSHLVDIQSRIPHLSSIGIKALHLRDVLMKNVSGDDMSQTFHPTGTAIKTFLKMFNGSEDQLRRFTTELHKHNMTLVVQIPVLEDGDEYLQGILSMALKHETEQVIKYLAEQGVDGISLAGMERFGSDRYIGDAVKSWHDCLIRYGNQNGFSKLLMTSYMFAHELTEHQNEDGQKALKYIQLLDATLDLSALDNLNKTTGLVADMVKWDAIQDRPWINWNLNFINNLPLSNAATAFQMLLPGTININSVEDSGQLRNLTHLRMVAVPIYMNGNYKRCDCEDGTTKETNYVLHHPIKDVIQLERFYSRRNRYVLVANFGPEPQQLGVITKIYTGGEVVLDTSNTMPGLHSHVLFKDMVLESGQAIVVKIPK